MQISIAEAASSQKGRGLRERSLLSVCSLSVLLWGGGVEHKGGSFFFLSCRNGKWQVLSLGPEQMAWTMPDLRTSGGWRGQGSDTNQLLISN